jgi:hypothetical protein
MEYALLVARQSIQGFMFQVQGAIGNMDRLTMLWIALVAFAVFLIFGLGRKPGT